MIAYEITLYPPNSNPKTDYIGDATVSADGRTVTGFELELVPNGRGTGFKSKKSSLTISNIGFVLRPRPDLVEIVD